MNCIILKQNFDAFYFTKHIDVTKIIERKITDE